MTTVSRYDPEPKTMKGVVVEGSNGDKAEYRTWMGIPWDLHAQLIGFAKADGVDLGSRTDTARAKANAEGKALKLYIMAATRSFDQERKALDAKRAQVAAEAAKAQAQKPAESKPVAQKPVETAPVAQKPAESKPTVKAPESKPAEKQPVLAGKAS